MGSIFKQRWDSFTRNYIEWGFAIVGGILLGLHLYQFIDSGFAWQAGMRVVFYAVFILSLLVIGERCIFWEMMAFALAYVQTITFDNYTPFMIVCACCLIKKNRKEYAIPCMIFYFIDILIVCIRHDKSAVHYCIHFIVCICIFFCVQMFIFFIKQKRPLILTEEEKHILYEIVYGGKKLKEIEGYKQNTISKKLKKMREKNGLKDNDELYAVFIEESTKRPQNSNKIPQQIDGTYEPLVLKSTHLTKLENRKNER